MLYLTIVSILWAISFGLTAKVAPLGGSVVAAVRIFLSLLVFLPFVRPVGLTPRKLLWLTAIGALEFGLMYVLYISAFRWMNAAEIALMTAFTPLLVTLFDDILERRMSWLFLGTASIAVVGTAICLWTDLDRAGLLQGFLVMQASNACFALGQVLYRRCAPATGKKDHELMGILYFGGTLIAVLAAIATFDSARFPTPTGEQITVLLYLGIIASGVGFFLFNAGARRVDVGALAIFNNVKIPLAILASALIFGAQVRWRYLVAGGSVIALALFLNEWVLAKRKAR